MKIPLALCAALLFTATNVRAQSHQVLFGSYFGGSDQEFGNAVAVGPGGDIWFAGSTHSTDLPVVNASQRTCGGGSGGRCQDGFLARLSADGQTVRFATYVGGSANDSIVAVAVDREGNAYAAGSWGDAAMAVRFDAQGRLRWRVVLGETPRTRATALAIDDDGNVYLTGQTSARFTTSNALFPNAGPPSCRAENGTTISLDAFVAKVSHDGELIFSTYLPGSGNDYGSAIGVDGLRRIYVGGGTTSEDLPIRDAFQSRYGGRIPLADECGAGDGFLLQLSADGSEILFGTYLGGGGNELVASVFVEISGLVALSGPTTSGNFPGAERLPLPPPTSFLARVDPRLKSLVLSRLVGPPIGAARWTPAGIAAAGTGQLLSIRGADLHVRELGGVGAFIQSAVPGGGGKIVATGSASFSNDFFRPVMPFQSQFGGFGDAFVLAAMPRSTEPELVMLNAASFAGPEVAPGSIATVFHGGDAAEIRFGSQVATVIVKTSGQTSLAVPGDLEAGVSAVEVVDADGRTIGRGATGVHPAAPGIFTADASGQGVAAAQLVRIAANGARTEESPFRCDEAGCRALPIPTSDAQFTSVLVLYATGLRNASAVQAFVNGRPAEVLYAGAQGEHEGLDQVNLRLQADLAGSGAVSIVLAADGRLSNSVRVAIE